MKRKRKDKRQRQRPRKSTSSYLWLIILLAGMVPAGLTVGTTYRIPARFIAPPIIVLLWIVGALLLWQQAHL